MIESIGDFIFGLTDTSNWPARWHCGNWSDFEGWLYIFSDLGIWAAYFAIPALILRITLKNEGVPFRPLFLLFFAFILLCGLTHLMDAIIFWWPAYRISSLIRFATSLVSWATVGAVYRFLPELLTFRSPEQLRVAIAQQTDELNKANQDLRVYTRRLTGQNNQLQEYAQITAHNLRSPVTNLKALIGIYKQEANAEKKQQIIERLASVVDILNTTLEDLHEVTRLRSDPTKQREIVAFSEILESVSTQILVKIQETGAVIESDFSMVRELPYQRSYLESIFLNLLTNAIKYAKPNSNPYIRFESFKYGAIIGLKVSDKGLGIDLEKHKSRIFGLHNTFHKHPDARGVGLYITKSMIENMGGEITVESKVGEGTSFTILFNADIN